MKEETITGSRCVHCLNVTETSELDHVFPKSWYPDTTPGNAQRWTVPSCPRCNREFGQLEKDLLVRLALCIDPQSDAASGLASRALRSMGIDVEGLSEEERLHREGLRKKIHFELMPKADLAGKPGAIPGLGPSGEQKASFAIPVPWASLSMVAEKIARGCEYKIGSRFVKPPYGLHTFIRKSEMTFPEAMKADVKVISFGPGCRVRRIFASEDPNVVRYWITIWNTLHFRVAIDQEIYLQESEANYSRPEGLDPLETPSMRIRPYLRNYRD